MDYLELHKKSLVIDCHSDIPFDLLLKHNKGEGNILIDKHLPQLREGEINIVFTNIYVENHPEGSMKDCMIEIAELYHNIDKSKEIVLLRSKEDLNKVIEENKLGIVLSFEGMEPVSNDLSLLRVYHELGLRSAMFTWNHRNYYASGVDEIGGLSSQGKETLKEMERLGIIVDVSHLNEEGFWDIMKLATKPVIASHSNAYSLYDHKRNLKDEQIRAIAETGGVIGLNSWFTACEKKGEGSIDKYIDHIEYIVNLVGDKHVGLGFDFTAYLGLDTHEVIGLTSAIDAPMVTKKLLERGFSEDQIKNILGKNFLRILEGVL